MLSGWLRWWILTLLVKVSDAIIKCSYISVSVQEVIVVDVVGDEVVIAFVVAIYSISLSNHCFLFGSGVPLRYRKVAGCC